MARRSTLLCATLAAATLVTTVVESANADDRTGATGSTFSSLPTGTIGAPPRGKVPGAVAGGEKVPGFFVAKGNFGRDFISIVPSARAAKQFEGGSREEPQPGEACFVEDQPQNRRFGNDDADRAWRGDLQPALMMQSSSTGGNRPAVTAVHSERVVEDGAKVSLEVVDAWVDPRSRGVRLIGKNTVPLLAVSTLLGGTRVFAARDGENVQIILVAPRALRGGSQDGIFSIVDTNVSHSPCDHMRVAIKSEKGQGHAASFVTNVQLATIEEKDAKPAEPKPGVPARIETRFRPIHVNASVTWPSREKEALLSVSAGWDSRERQGQGSGF